MTRSIVPLPLSLDLVRDPHGPAVTALRKAFDGTGPAVAPHAPDAPPTVPDGAATEIDDAAVIIGTSGSTGTPKLAVLTAPALHASADATHAHLGGPGTWELALPPHHVAGLQVVLRGLRAGDVRERSYLSLVPTQLVRALGLPDMLARLRAKDAVLVGGAAADPEVLERARSAGVRAVTTYGGSETCGGCVYDGRPLPEVEARIADDGRVELTGPTLFAGYLNDPVRTFQALRVDPDGRRWFRTDDLGELGEDGRLTILGRADDVITTGGVKVAPRVVEAAVRGLPGVRECLVAGVPDPEWGQAVGAALVADRDWSLLELREALRGTLPDHALPRRAVRLAELPVIGPGKPDRAAVRAALAMAD